MVQADVYFQLLSCFWITWTVSQIILSMLQKLLFIHTAEGVSSNLRPCWEEAVRGRAGVVQAQADMLEIVPAGTNKGSGVKLLLDHLDITANEVCPKYSSGVAFLILYYNL